MIIRHSEISKSVKYWVKPDIESRILEGSIKAHFNAELTEIKENTVIFKNEKGPDLRSGPFIMLILEKIL